MRRLVATTFLFSVVGGVGCGEWSPPPPSVEAYPGPCGAAIERGEQRQVQLDYRYDDADRWVEIVEESEDSLVSTTRSFTDSGAVERVEVRSSTEPDRERVTRYRYDEVGRLVERIDERAATTTRLRIVWDEQSRKREERLDEGDDGEVDWVTSFVYERDVLLEEVRRNQRDSGIYTRTVHGYSESQLRLSSVTFDGAGRLVARTEYQYWDDGTTREIARDLDGDETFDWRLQYDEEGRLVSEFFFGVGDQSPYGELREYDEAGNELYRRRDEGLDGTPDDVTTFFYTCWQ